MIEGLRAVFDPARIVYEDDDVIAVDKPEGVPSQATDPAHPDDIVHRLGRFIAERAGHGRAAYVGVHQRLDQDTSGVLVYAKRKEANAALARQLEGHAAERRYVAVVDGWRGPGRTLEHGLARGRDGKTHVAEAGSRRAQRSVSHVKVLTRNGSRALVEVRADTGRTHSVRAQLAHEGAPIVGDRLYGGAPAARLMLHASRLGLSHPRTSTPFVIQAPTPAMFEYALDPRQEAPLSVAIAQALERRWGLGHRDGDDPTNAFRLLHEAGDSAPGLAVDQYDDWLVVHFYSDALDEESVLDALEPLGARGIYVKRRPRQANVIVDGRDEALAPSRPLRGEPAPDELQILEHGLPYRVRLGEGLSTGIFLDQRDNRRRIRELSNDARVLNLFAYTAAFTVAAAAGGARESLSVDASARLTQWGRHNLEQAGLASDAHRFEVGDAFDALARLNREGSRFDLICLDPPTYSTTRSSRWRSGNDWRKLGAMALGVLAPGGRLLACSNDRRMGATKLRRHLHEAARDAGARLAQMKDLACPSDFPPPFGAEPHLKSILCTRAS